MDARRADVYRDLLLRAARENDVRELVTFDPAYRTAGALATLVRRADVVVLPYEVRDRTTSAVLTEAVAARRPVIATAFPHARELLGDGAGLIVPHRDPVALARALRRVLTEPELVESMRVKSGQLAAALGLARRGGRLPRRRARRGEPHPGRRTELIRSDDRA